MKAPSFWHLPTSRLAKILAPLGYLYDQISRFLRGLKTPVTLPIPVICVGNLVMGGAGKTPVALLMAQELKKRGRVCHFLTRGYGGRLKGPVQVCPDHDPSDVGDEPLILAQVAPTWVARDRALGGQAAVQAGADVVILDDGHQNETLIKDLSLLVIDTDYGHGNGQVFPAGPLRESVTAGYARAQGLVLIGDQPWVTPPSLPVVRLKFVPRAGDMQGLTHKSLILFAGIGRPSKFFQMMAEYQERYHFKILEKIDYADHHVYTSKDIAFLQQKAWQQGACLVTTEKDAIRCQALLENLYTVHITPHVVEGAWNSFWQILKI